jgi:hypothetical protein
MISLKQSWLHGEMPPKSKKSRIMPAVTLAREYFQGWAEKEIREFWRGTELMIHEFIHNHMGKISFITNPLTILYSELIATIEPFKKFMKKWTPKFEKGALAKRQNVTLGEVLLAAFLLKNAADGNATTVMDIYSLISPTYIRAVTLKQRLKSIISDENRKSAQAPRKRTLRKLIEAVLKTDPQKNYLAVLNELTKRNQQTNIFHIKCISENGTKYVHLTETNGKSKTIIQSPTLLNFAKMVSAARISLKK